MVEQPVGKGQGYHCRLPLLGQKPAVKACFELALIGNYVIVFLN